MLLAHQKPLLQPLFGSFSDNVGSGLIEISQSGLLALANHEYVSVIDLHTNQVVQTLRNNTTASVAGSNAQATNTNLPLVQMVRWARENYHHDLMSPYLLRLAVVSNQGYITIWDITRGAILCGFRHAHTLVNDLHWIEKQDSSHDLLLALHAPSEFVLWNADTGTQLWRRFYHETVYRFHVDPYDTKNIVFLANKCILLVNDFSFSQAPIGNPRKFYVCGPSPSGTDASNMPRSTSDNLLSRSTQLLQSTLKLVKGTAGEGASTSVNGNYNDMLDVQFHPSLRGHLLTLFPRELLLLDMLLSQTVASIRLENNAAPFLQVRPCRQGDYFYCLHANGCITFRGRQPMFRQVSKSIENSNEENENELLMPSYHICAQTEPVRLSKQVQLIGMCVDPRSEMDVCLLTTDGKIQMWSLFTHPLNPYKEEDEEKLGEISCNGSNLSKSTSSDLGVLLKKSSVTSSVSHERILEFSRLSDVVEPIQIVPVQDTSLLCRDVSTHDVEQVSSQMGQFHFIMCGYHCGVIEDVRLMSMCPPPKRSTASLYQPLLALGSAKGHLQVWHLGYNSIQYEMQVFPNNTPIHGMEWITDRSIVVYHSVSTVTPSSPQSGSSNASSTNTSTSHASLHRSSSSNLRNEFCVINLDSGQVLPFRQKLMLSSTANVSDPPVKDIKVSHLRQYMLILFDGDKSVEVWDTKNFTLLYEFRGLTSRILLAEWTNLRGHSLSNLPVKDGTASLIRQESVVLVDQEHQIHLFQIEGVIANKKSSIPIGNGVNRVTALAWKDDLIALGDIDGNVMLWNLKAKVTQNHSLTSGGAVKKLRFAFGKGSRRLLLLQADCVEIWQITSEALNRSHMRLHRDWAPLLSMEWIDFCHICGAFQDGILRMFDADTLTETNLPLSMDSLKEPILQPAILPPKVNLLLQLLLQNQAENENYSLKECPPLANGFEKVATQVTTFLHSMEKRDLLKCFEGNPQEEAVPSIAERCYLTAVLFGDEYETKFWSIVMHFHRVAKLNSTDNETPTILSLGLGFDSLCDEKVFRAHQALRVAQLEAKKITEEQSRKCIEALIMLGQLDRAIKELINSNPEQSGTHYIKDVYKACLLSSLIDQRLHIQSNSSLTPRTATNTHKAMKTAAVSLISNGELSEGVQILCSIGLLQEACHYLMSYNKWEMALWLAKCTMSAEERGNVLTKWALHLRSPQVNEKSLSLLVLISLGLHKEILEHLYSLRHFTMATRYLESCIQSGLLDKYPEDEICSLKQAVFLEFARFLMSLGYRSSALYYCSLAGEKGQKLKKEVDFLIGD